MFITRTLHLVSSNSRANASVDDPQRNQRAISKFQGSINNVAELKQYSLEAFSAAGTEYRTET